VHQFTEDGLHVVSEGKTKTPKHRFAWMYNQTEGGTPLTGSLIKAAALQKARGGAKRKVLFVITDGGDNDGPEGVKAAGEYIERRMGIEIANLHIGSTPMGLFRNEVAVNTSKVVDTGLRKLVSVLEAGAVR
jgi:Mg-chelatase subunit ChlD